MTDVARDKCTSVKFLFEGEKHKEAASAFLIQIADGGMDEDIESRLQGQGFTVNDTGFSIERNEITIKIG